MRRDSPAAWWLTGRKSYRVQYGGRGSGKTYSATEALIYLMLTCRVRILCIRKVQKALKHSVKTELERWIRWRKVEHAFDVQRDVIVCTSTGSTAEFHGADLQTVESLRSTAAGVGVCLIEEAHQIPQDVWDILEPSLRPARPDQHIELWACFNPTRESDPVYSTFVQQRKGEAEGRLQIKEVNWQQNAWFPDKLEHDRLHDLEHMPKALYLHKWEGQLHPGDAPTGWYPLLQRRHVRACFDRDWWAKRPRSPVGKSTLGHDVGEPDTRNNAIVVRRGPIVEWAEKFAADSWDGVGNHCRAAFAKHGCNHVFVDSTGVGQGAISQYDVHGLKWHPVRFGGPVQGRKRRWLPGTTNDDMWAMRNAQLAWAVKLRIENTWRAQHGDPVDPALCMWINPDIPERDLFVSECALPLWTQVQGERRVKLDKYGGGDVSPDLFDSLCLAFAMDSVSGLRASDWNVGASDLAA